MIRLLKKHSALIAVAVILAAFVAAPYLVPTDPDSRVFRSGTLCAILLAACFVPVEEAIARADRRTLLSSLAWGLLLAVALGLGSELRFYEGLLPGSGSALRRLAVPILAAPLLGCLCARLMLAGGKAHSLRVLNWPLPVYMGIMLLCWLPILLAYFPGMLNYDFLTEYGQFTGSYYDKRHPILYLLINGGLITLGEMIHSRSFGLLLSSIAHMLVFSAALASSCTFLQRHKAPAWATLLLAACYALMPIFSVMSVSTSKDTPFTAALLVLSLLSWEALEDPDTFFAGKKKCVLFVLMTIGTAHMRKNGIAALIPLFPLLIAAAKNARVRVAALAAVSVGCSLLVTLGLEMGFSLHDQPSFQLYSLPAQQLVRAYNLSDDLTEAEREEIRSWYTDEYGLRLIPQLADGAKGYLNQDRLSENPAEFLSLWARIGKKNARLYTEAFLLMNLGSWYPDDLTYSRIYDRTGAWLKGYLELEELDLTDFGIETTCLLPSVRNFYEHMCRYNEYTKYPIISLLFCPASAFFMTLFACALFIARGNTRMCVLATGPLGLWISYLFGPCALPRYSLPLYAIGPTLLCMAFLLPRRNLRKIPDDAENTL